MKTYPHIGLDIDGVLANTGKQLAVWAKRLGITYGVRPDRWYSQQSFVPHTDDWDTLWDAVKVNEDFWAKIDVFRDDEIIDYYPGAYVTARNTKMLGITKWWLFERFNFPAAHVECTAYWEQKPQILRRLGITTYIDDRPEAFEHYRKAGLDCRLMDRPWNQHVATRYRVYSVNEVIQ